MANHPENNRYAFPLSIQIAMPESLDSPDFINLLECLQRRGFHGVEMNITDFDRCRPSDFSETLAAYGLKLTYIASGAYAKKNGLSLISEDQAIRAQTVAELKKILRFAAEMDAGVICGFIKGPAGGETNSSRVNILDSLKRLDPLVRELKAPLLLEATNHYEATVANTLAQAALLIRPFENPYFQILPDTYHMNISEAASFQAFAVHLPLFKSFHVSDNNRLFPGLGAIDFFPILAGLKGLGFSGSMGIEGNSRGNLAAEVEFAAEYLENVSRRVALLAQGNL